jgi:DNA-binding SARP family transcriptional activator
MNSVLQVALLGGFQLRYGNKDINTVKTSRLQSLFAYIILHRQAPIPRQQIASLFWLETSEIQSRTNLRNLIHQLRKAFPYFDSFISTDANSLAWIKDTPYTLDVLTFERCLSVIPGQTLQKENLEQAVQTYRGGLLPSCYDDWIIPERERLSQAFQHALEALAVMAEEARDYPSALAYAKRLVRVDPLLPAANQQFIRLYSLLNDRSAAIKSYQSYARKLFRELGVEPEIEIQDLYHQIQRQSGQASESTNRTSIPLVGRNAEWQKLRSIWKYASTGRPQIIFLSGDAGIGKSRLVEELATWAALLGIPTSTAICYPAEGSLPYAPVVSWVRSQSLPNLEKIWLAEISRLVPGILQKHPGLPKKEPLHEAWQRQRLFEALARALLAKKQARILILEDIHWCDQDTLEWLHYLLRFNPNAPLLIVATIRSGEIQPDHPLAALQTTLRAEGRYTEIELTALNKGDTMTLIDHIAREISGQYLNSEVALQIARESEGNPLFAIERVRLGQISQNAHGAGSRLSEDTERAKAILARRISQLSSGTRETTCMAAVIGREFSLTTLQQASAESEENVVKAIDEMLQRRIIREISADTYDFTHDRLREAAFEGISNAHRRLLHRRLAETYLQLDAASPRPRNAEIASHYEHAGLAVQAIRQYRLAAEVSAGIFANADAWGYLHRAVELSESVGVGDHRDISFEDFATMLEKTGDLLALDGKYPQALPNFERALAQPFGQTGLWQSQLYRKISDAYIPLYLHDRAYTALEQAEQSLRIAPPAGTILEQQEWLQIQLDRIQLYYWDNLPEKMEALIQQIEVLVASVGRIGQQNTFLSLHYQARMRRERYHLSRETVQIVQQRLYQAEKLNDAYNLAIAQFQYGFALLWHGDPVLAREWLDRSNDALATIGARIWQLRSLAYISVVSRKLHQPDRLRNELPPLLELGQVMNEYTYLGIGLANQAWLAWLDGDAAQAKQLCEEAISVWENFSGCVFHALADWVLMDIAVARRDFDGAEAAARALMDPNPTFQAIEEPMYSQLSQALDACETREWTTALELFRRALEAARAAGEL